MISGVSIMLQYVLIISESGINLVKYASPKYEDFEINEQLFSGLLTAIKQMGDSIVKKSLDMISFGDYDLYYLERDRLIVVLIPRPELDKKRIPLILNGIIDDFETQFGNFDPTIDMFQSFRERIKMYEYREELYNEAIKVAKNFPEGVVGVARKKLEELEKEFSMEDAQKLIHDFGLFVGLRIKNKKDRVETLDWALNEISVAEIKKGMVILDICPFCRGRHTHISVCNFATGLIEGILSDQDPSEILSHEQCKVKYVETYCKAKGDPTCTFIES